MEPTTGSRYECERAFSMVELMVVLLVTSILISIGWSSVRSARSVGTHNIAVSAAHSYANAADSFARDHEGRYPAAPGSVDWPVARTGPRSPLLGSKGYLRSVPESVQDNIVVIGPRGSAPAGLTYQVQGSGYEIIVDVRNRDACTIRGGGATSSINQCSRR